MKLIYNISWGKKEIKTVARLQETHNLRNVTKENTFWQVNSWKIEPIATQAETKNPVLNLRMARFHTSLLHNLLLSALISEELMLHFTEKADEPVSPLVGAGDKEKARDTSIVAVLSLSCTQSPEALAHMWVLTQEVGLGSSALLINSQ